MDKITPRQIQFFVNSLSKEGANERTGKSDELAQQVGSKWINSDRLFVKWNGEPMNNNTPYFWLN